MICEGETGGKFGSKVISGGIIEVKSYATNAFLWENF
jgi:hypothetical protein